MPLIPQIRAETSLDMWYKCFVTFLKPIKFLEKWGVGSREEGGVKEGAGECGIVLH